MKALQLMCEPISVQSIQENIATISSQPVLFAELNGVHVGLCVSLLPVAATEPLFLQVVGVVEAARKRGIGIALMKAAVDEAPGRTVAFATQDTNRAAHAMNQRLATIIDGDLRAVPLGTYRDKALGIRRGLGYRAWSIDRSAPSPESSKG
ncbi:hypothetical protein DEJ33_06880 [Curtobacterium sp. MCPF17_047]|nr:hypothetical protein DEJ33_06880 [Curtobacterium sp. MCPF17_047]